MEKEDSELESWYKYWFLSKRALGEPEDDFEEDDLEEDEFFDEGEEGD